MRHVEYGTCTVIPACLSWKGNMETKFLHLLSPHLTDSSQHLKTILSKFGKFAGGIMALSKRCTVSQAVLESNTAELSLIAECERMLFFMNTLDLFTRGLNGVISEPSDLQEGCVSAGEGTRDGGFCFSPILFFCLLPARHLPRCGCHEVPWGAVTFRRPRGDWGLSGREAAVWIVTRYSRATSVVGMAR